MVVPAGDKAAKTLLQQRGAAPEEALKVRQWTSLDKKATKAFSGQSGTVTLTSTPKKERGTATLTSTPKMDHASSRANLVSGGALVNMGSTATITGSIKVSPGLGSPQASSTVVSSSADVEHLDGRGKRRRSIRKARTDTAVKAGRMSQKMHFDVNAASETGTDETLTAGTGTQNGASTLEAYKSTTHAPIPHQKDSTATAMMNLFGLCACVGTSIYVLPVTFCLDVLFVHWIVWAVAHCFLCKLVMFAFVPQGSDLNSTELDGVAPWSYILSTVRAGLFALLALTSLGYLFFVVVPAAPSERQDFFLNALEFRFPRDKHLETSLCRQIVTRNATWGIHGVPCMVEDDNFQNQLDTATFVRQNAEKLSVISALESTAASATSYAQQLQGANQAPYDYSDIYTYLKMATGTVDSVISGATACVRSILFFSESTLTELEDDPAYLQHIHGFQNTYVGFEDVSTWLDFEFRKLYMVAGDTSNLNSTPEIELMNLWICVFSSFFCGMMLSDLYNYKGFPALWGDIGLWFHHGFAVISLTHFFWCNCRGPVFCITVTVVGEMGTSAFSFAALKSDSRFRRGVYWFVMSLSNILMMLSWFAVKWCCWPDYYWSFAWTVSFTALTCARQAVMRSNIQTWAAKCGAIDSSSDSGDDSEDGSKSKVE
ncbi:unnamed protein product [Amoebophrya sp. A25]|nr:unnamed protein product [Amoebophrya sp. A25]|eukprot:GSA25T00018666001.1